MSKKYCWSVNGERYEGSCDTEAEAIEEAIEYIDRDSEEPFEADIYIGTQKFCIEYLRDGITRTVENLLYSIDDTIGYEIAAEDNIISASKERKDELGQLIIGWFEKHEPWSGWYGVTDIHVVNVKIETDGSYVSSIRGEK